MGWFSSSPMERETKRGIVEMRRLEHEARMRHDAELAAVARDLKQKLREQGRARGWFR